MDILSIVKQNILYIIIFIILLVFTLPLLIYATKKSPIENLENVSIDDKVQSHEVEVKQNEIPIDPTLYDAGSGTIMSGPEFIPSKFLSPWYQAYTGDLKNYYLLDDGEGGTMGLNFNMCSNHVAVISIHYHSKCQ
jgi:hypothetical protein